MSQADRPVKMNLFESGEDLLIDILPIIEFDWNQFYFFGVPKSTPQMLRKASANVFS